MIDENNKRKNIFIIVLGLISTLIALPLGVVSRIGLLTLIFLIIGLPLLIKGAYGLYVNNKERKNIFILVVGIIITLIALPVGFALKTGLLSIILLIIGVIPLIMGVYGLYVNGSYEEIKKFHHFIKNTNINTEKVGKKNLALIIIGIIVFLAIITIVSSIMFISNIGEIQEPKTTAQVVGELNITDITSYARASGYSDDPSYYYGVSGMIENLSIFGEGTNIDDGSFSVEAKFYDTNGNLLETKTTDYISKESGAKSSFSSSNLVFSSEKKLSIGKVEIALFNKNGTELVSTVYQFNNNVFEDDTSKRPEEITESSENNESSTNSDSSSSSGTTFNDGFKDGVNDAHNGYSAKYTYDTVSYDSSEYAQGYADGYASYRQNPHLYQDLIR